MIFRGLAVPRFFIHSSIDGPLDCFQGVFGKDLRGLTKVPAGAGEGPTMTQGPGQGWAESSVAMRRGGGGGGGGGRGTREQTVSWGETSQASSAAGDWRQLLAADTRGS